MYAYRGSLYKESRYAFLFIVGRVSIGCVCAMARAHHMRMKK